MIKIWAYLRKVFYQLHYSAVKNGALGSLLVVYMSTILYFIIYLKILTLLSYWSVYKKDQNWDDENGYKFSKTKTACVHFVPNEKFHDVLSLHLDGK